MPRDWAYDTFLSEEPGRAQRNIIETSSDVAQIKAYPGADQKNSGPYTGKCT